MAIRSVGRGLVLFFTRPMHFSDLRAVWRAFRHPQKDAPKNGDRSLDFEPTRLVERPGDLTDAWGRSHELEVSEEPLHTLPAELQEEFGVTKPRVVVPPISRE